MRRTELLQEIRAMRFEEAYAGWQEGRLRQEEVARLLGVCERTFRRYIDRYEEAGLEGLIDRRLAQVSHRRAPVDEVMALQDAYRRRHLGWSVKHFYAWYRRARRRPAQLYVGQERSAGGEAGRQGAGAGQEPQAARTFAVAGDDAAPGRQYARVGAGRAVGSDRHDGRCDQRALLLRGGERHCVESARDPGGDRGAWPVLEPLHRPGAATTGTRGTRARPAARWIARFPPKSGGRSRTWASI